MLILDRADNVKKNIATNEKGSFIMIKRSVHQEDVIILNIIVLQNT